MIRIRHNDWQTKFYAYCNSKQSVKFKYGSHDCVKFSAGAVKAMTRLDVLAKIGSYKSLREGKALIDSYGGLFRATHYCVTEYPIAAVPVGEAVTGDVVGFLNDKGNEQIGIMYDLGSIISVAKTGVIYIPAHSRVKRCWSV